MPKNSTLTSSFHGTPSQNPHTPRPDDDEEEEDEEKKEKV